MKIDSHRLIPFLTEFATLCSNHQRVFLHCLLHLPHPCWHSSDTRSISDSLQLSLRTVQRALACINRTRHLSHLVYYCRINQRREFHRQLQEIYRTGEEDDHEE